MQTRGRCGAMKCTLFGMVRTYIDMLFIFIRNKFCVSMLPDSLNQYNILPFSRDLTGIVKLVLKLLWVKGNIVILG